MDSNPICDPSEAKKVKCSFLYYIQLLMIGRAGHWTQTPSTCPLKQKKWNAHFLDYIYLLMINWAGWWTRTPSATLLQPKKRNANFWITFYFWRSAVLVNGLEPHLPPFSNQKNEMLIFGLHSTSDDWPGWSMDSNPICHPSPAKKIKCSFLDYVQLLMIGQVGWWTQTPSATPLQPKKWNACFWIMFNFWWSAGLVNGFKPHPPPISSQKNEMLIFGLLSISGDQPGWSMDLNPICHPSPTKKMICSFLDYVQLLMIGQAGQWSQTPSATPLQPKKWNAHFWITFNFWWSASSTSDDWPGWSKDSNPICNLFPTKKMKCSFLYYVQILVISRAGRWTRTPFATLLQPKKWNACFVLCSNSDDQPGWLMDSNPIHHLSPAKEWNAHFWITFNFWWLARLVDELKPHLPPLSSQKNENLIFGLCSTSDDQPGWLMDSNPICHLSSAKKWNADFWITFNFWWLTGLVIGLEPHAPPLSNQ